MVSNGQIFSEPHYIIRTFLSDIPILEQGLIVQDFKMHGMQTWLWNFRQLLQLHTDNSETLAAVNNLVLKKVNDRDRWMLLSTMVLVPLFAQYYQTQGTPISPEGLQSEQDLQDFENVNQFMEDYVVIGNDIASVRLPLYQFFLHHSLKNIQNLATASMNAWADRNRRTFEDVKQLKKELMNLYVTWTNLLFA
jgi:hypothetical protein